MTNFRDKDAKFMLSALGLSYNCDFLVGGAYSVTITRSMKRRLRAICRRLEREWRITETRIQFAKEMRAKRDASKS